MKFAGGAMLESGERLRQSSLRRADGAQLVERQIVSVVEGDAANERQQPSRCQGTADIGADDVGSAEWSGPPGDAIDSRRLAATWPSAEHCRSASRRVLAR